ncbi:MAG: hydrogenase iron-sulfur subunit [Chloroflexi bacterium]|nr:hydrogenase iron-sulfur subunit [Chloroflexota bacterium]
MREYLREKPEEKILVLMCHWCSYGGADNAGVSHFQYPPNSRGIRVMCSARMDQDLVLEAFRRGAGMVLVSGCHPQDCHYISGQQVAARRFGRLVYTLQRLGINPERFRVEWISAAEGEKYARVITEMSQKLASFDREALRRENEAARKAIMQRLLRWRLLPDMAAVLAEEEEEKEVVLE